MATGVGVAEAAMATAIDIETGHVTTRGSIVQTVGNTPTAATVAVAVVVEIRTTTVIEGRTVAIEEATTTARIDGAVPQGTRSRRGGQVTLIQPVLQASSRCTS